MPKCRVCKQPFVRINSLHVVCSPVCAIEYSKTTRAAKEAKEYREKKASLKSRAEWLREAQAAVNAYVRERDSGQLCISCGRWHDGQWHAGHYLSVGSHPELRFDPLNIHKQCQPCNTYLSGNQLNFRAGLIRKIGIDAVEKLESNHASKHYTIEDAKSIRDEFKVKLKQLKSDKKETA